MPELEYSDAILALITLLAVFVALLSVMHTRRNANAAKDASESAKISASASEKSAQAAEESNRIAEENLKTYRDEIAFARRIMVKAHVGHGFIGEREFSHDDHILYRSDRPNGIYTVVHLRNLGAAILIENSSIEFFDDIDYPIAKLHEKDEKPKFLAAHDSCKLRFLMTKELCDAYLNSTPADSATLELRLAEGAIEPIEFDKEDLMRLRDAVYEWDSLAKNFGLKRLYGPGIPDGYGFADMG